MGGVETYLRELVAALLALDDPPRLAVFANPDGFASLSDERWAGEVELVCCPRLGRSGARALSELSVIGALADRRGANVVHSVAMTGPLASRAARVTTLHDTTWITHPADAATTRLWRTVLPYVAARSHRVITGAQVAADDLVDHLGVQRAKIDVVPHGFDGAVAADVIDMRERLGLGAGPVVLNVGQKGPHRNLARLIDAFARVRDDHPGATLVLPGPPNPRAEAELRARAAGLGFQIVLPGFVSSAELEGLWRAADVFVMPSLVEGFGLPVLEALARGVPTACSGQSATAEVAGAAALQFDPTDTRAIATAILTLLGDPALAERLRAAGPQRAAAFTWSRCAELTRASYRRAHAARGGRRRW